MHTSSGYLKWRAYFGFTCNVPKCGKRLRNWLKLTLYAYGHAALTCIYMQWREENVVVYLRCDRALRVDGPCVHAIPAHRFLNVSRVTSVRVSGGAVVPDFELVQAPFGMLPRFTKTRTSVGTPTTRARRPWPRSRASWSQGHFDRKNLVSNLHQVIHQHRAL